MKFPVPKFPRPRVFDLRVNQPPSYLVKQRGGKKGFAGTAAKAGNKLYVVANDDDGGTIHYVGITTRSMKVRFDASIKANNKLNRNYSWAGLTGEFKLFVWDLNKAARNKRDLESIESEFTLAARVMQKGWPVHQRGIMFSHFLAGNHIRSASAVAGKMCEQYYDVLLDRPKLTKRTKRFLSKEKSQVLRILNGIMYY